jgi:hypothetical protein
MTAHWAFILPISYAYLLKKSPLPLRLSALILMFALTIFLWWHNLSLVAQHIFA